MAPFKTHTVPDPSTAMAPLGRIDAVHVSAGWRTGVPLATGLPLISALYPAYSAMSPGVPLLLTQTKPDAVDGQAVAGHGAAAAEGAAGNRLAVKVNSLSELSLLRVQAFPC